MLQTPAKSAVTLAITIVISSALGAVPALANPCSVETGARVLLAAEGSDPDVFLWDSRMRMIAYSAGQWGSTQVIFAHTMLAHPETQAIVVACVAGVAHMQYDGSDQDAVGVKVVRGPLRGRYGWVLSSDVHASRSSRQTSHRDKTVGGG